MDRQTLRDWVIRFNDQGPGGLINKSSPGAPGLARLVEEGPIPAVHGVVRWRACDLIMRLHEEFGISVSDDTVYRARDDSLQPDVPSSGRDRRQREIVAIDRRRAGGDRTRRALGGSSL